MHAAVSATARTTTMMMFLIVTCPSELRAFRPLTVAGEKSGPPQTRPEVLTQLRNPAIAQSTSLILSKALPIRDARRHSQSRLGSPKVCGCLVEANNV
jgi:hypothetical protein